jgi:hypothetical protein
MLTCAGVFMRIALACRTLPHPLNAETPVPRATTTSYHSAACNPAGTTARLASLGSPSSLWHLALAADELQHVFGRPGVAARCSIFCSHAAGCARLRVQEWLPL